MTEVADALTSPITVTKKTPPGPALPSPQKIAGTPVAQPAPKPQAPEPATVRPPDTEPVQSIMAEQLESSPLNPRKTFDEAKIAQLGESIAAQGVLQNLVVRPHPKRPGRYEICAGESRWRAVMALVKAGRLDKGYALPCRVRPIDDRTLLELALTENVQRNDLTPLEEAEAFKRLVDMKVGTDKIAERIGCSRRLVQLRLDLLDRLHPDAREALRDRRIPLEHARELTRTPVAAQPAILKEMIPNKSGEARLDSAREIRRVVQSALIPVARALFDRKLYTGEIRVDDETKAECFMDAALFERLQKQAIEQRKAELQKKWPWVELKVEKWSHHGLPYGYQEKPKAEKAGALIVYVTESGRLHVYEGVIERDNPKRGGTEPRRYGALEKKPAAAKVDPFDPQFDPQAFAHHIRKIKTNALRLAIVNGPVAVAMRIAIADLAGDLEFHGTRGRAENQHPDVAAALRKYVDPIAAGPYDPAAAIAKAGALAPRDIEPALKAAVAAAVNAETEGYDLRELGDHETTLALARLAGADVRKAWSLAGKQGESFLALCGSKQLNIMALEQAIAPATDTKPATLKALRAEILKKAAKDYLPPWLHWRSSADLYKALAPKKAAAPAAKAKQKKKW